MHTVIGPGELLPHESGTLRCEGQAYGSGVSVFLVNNPPGQGARRHRHPYSEPWIVRSGRARLTLDSDEIEAGPGDIAVAGPNTPHIFRTIGPGRLELVCIHASSCFIQEDLELR